MFTLYSIAFHAVLLSCTIQCEQIFFAVMVSMILKIFSVNHVLDKSKRQKQTFVKKYCTMSKVTKTYLCWTDDEIQLLLEPVSYCKCKREY